MIESLLEMSVTTASGDAVGQILAVLRELRGKIEAQQAADQALEESRIAAWAALLNQLTTQRANALNRKGVLETNIVNYHTIIEDNTSSLAMHEDEAERFAVLNANW